MKHSEDLSTVDLFPVQSRRGRPATGKAKTSAQRQANYRVRKNDSADQSNLNVWIDRKAKSALFRLAAHSSVTPAEILQRFLLQAEQELCDSLYLEGGEAWDKYWGVKTQLSDLLR